MNDTIAPLLVRWMTHDFATPVSTIMTASELLSDVPDAEINELIQDGARRLANRLRLVRSALAPGESPIGAKALAALIRGGIEGGSVDWQHAAADFDGATAAVIAGTALLLADLRRGAPLVITDAGAEWTTPGELPAAVTAALAGAAPTDSRSALAAMVRQSASNASLALAPTAAGIGWQPAP